MSVAIWGWLPGETVISHPGRNSLLFLKLPTDTTPLSLYLENCVVGMLCLRRDSLAKVDTTQLPCKKKQALTWSSCKHVSSINTCLPSFLQQLLRVTSVLLLWIILEEIAFLPPNDLGTKQAPHSIKSNYLKKLVQRGVEIQLKLRS